MTVRAAQLLPPGVDEAVAAAIAAVSPSRGYLPGARRAYSKQQLPAYSKQQAAAHAPHVGAHDDATGPAQRSAAGPPTPTALGPLSPPPQQPPPSRCDEPSAHHGAYDAQHGAYDAQHDAMMAADIAAAHRRARMRVGPTDVPAAAAARPPRFALDATDALAASVAAGATSATLADTLGGLAQMAASDLGGVDGLLAADGGLMGGRMMMAVADAAPLAALDRSHAERLAAPAVPPARRPAAIIRTHHVKLASHKQMVSSPTVEQIEDACKSASLLLCSPVKVVTRCSSSLAAKQHGQHGA